MQSASPPRARLDSWKAIAHHLNRTVRTVQRWEREQGLPVHRLHLNKLGTVYAYVDEIDQWWDQRRVSLAIASNESVAPNDGVASSNEQFPPHPIPDRSAPSVQWRGRSLIAALVAAMVVMIAAIDSRGTNRSSDKSRQLCAEGRAHWNKRTPEALRAALQTFERAVQADPLSVCAHAGVADSYSVLYAFGVMSKADALSAAHAAALRALELGPEFAESHTSLSFVLWEQGDRAAALRTIEKGIAVDPHYATAFHWYALYLLDSGRYLPALDAARRAVSLDPASPIIKTDLAIILRAAGHRDEAVAVLQSVNRETPAFPDAYLQLAETYRLERNYDLAAKHLVMAMQHGDQRPFTTARLGWMQAKSGDVLGAVAAVARLRTMQAQGERVHPLTLLEALAAAGDHDTAFQLIDEGLAANAPWLLHVQSQDVFDGLRKDARWSRVNQSLRPLVAQQARDSIVKQSEP